MKNTGKANTPAKKSTTASSSASAAPSASSSTSKKADTKASNQTIAAVSSAFGLGSSENKELVNEVNLICGPFGCFTSNLLYASLPHC